MPHQWREDEALPLSVRRPLTEWVDGVTQALGTDCLAIVLTGPLTRGDDAYSHRTPVDLVVVLTEVDVGRVVLTRIDLNRSTDVFPTRFLSLQQHHLLLHGVDVLNGLAIARDHLRLRCEQELKDLVLQLRELYLHRSHQLQGLLGTIADANLRFVDTLESVLRLRGAELPARRAEVAESAAGLISCDLAVVQEWLGVARGDLTPGRDQARAMVQRLLEAADSAARAVDAMDQRDTV
jgi:hypothetical protein